MSEITPSYGLGRVSDEAKPRVKINPMCGPGYALHNSLAIVG